MRTSLIERAAPLAAARSALARLPSGLGGLLLISGEAGIGKTSLLEAALAEAEGVRVLRGRCDDLVAANPLGPLREATRDLAVSSRLSGGSVGELLPDLVTELAVTPTALVVEDVHWADDATIDVLIYLARRTDVLPVLILLSYRDDEVGAEHPLRRLLASGPADRTERLELTPLGRDGVERLTVGTGWDGEQLHALTGGNPFFLTEVLAAPPDAPVPHSVAEAVLARTRPLGPRSRDCLERLSVWPGQLEFDVATRWLGPDLAALDEAEQRGLITVSAGGLAFRHELARRATEASLPGLRRRALQAEVTAVLRAEPEAHLTRLVHHAVLCGDAATVAEFAPVAGRRSAAAGAHRQALVFFAAALRHRDRLGPEVLAEVLDGHAWELYNASRFAEAAEHAERAVAQWRRIGRVEREAEALGQLSRHLFMLGEVDAAQRRAEQAVAVGGAALGSSLAARGALLALDADATEASSVLERAADRIASDGPEALSALVLNYSSSARPDLDAEARLDLLRRSIEQARRCGADEFEARGYTNLGELLYRYGRHDELAASLPAWLGFVREHGFWSHASNLELHDALLRLRRGDWPGGEQRLLGLIERYPDPGMLSVYVVPPYARQLARRGDPAAGPLLHDVWQRAVRQRTIIGLGYAGAALVEWAWLNGAEGTIGEVVACWTRYGDRPTAAPLWAEIRRYASRAGCPVPAGPPSESCEPWDLGLAGDPLAAAAAWRLIGDPYEEALELAECGVEPASRALSQLDELGATATADAVQRQLRGAGVRVPRPSRTTRANPNGLTDRQLDIAGLLGEGMTNAEIAERLFLSVRTVDSHVSAILAKLGVSGRRAAVRQLRSANQL